MFQALAKKILLWRVSGKTASANKGHLTVSERLSRLGTTKTGVLEPGVGPSWSPSMTLRTQVNTSKECKKLWNWQ
jgi:hypothetical protein